MLTINKLSPKDGLIATGNLAKILRRVGTEVTALITTKKKNKRRQTEYIFFHLIERLEEDDDLQEELDQLLELLYGQPVGTLDLSDVLKTFTKVWRYHRLSDVWVAAYELGIVSSRDLANAFWVTHSE